MRWDTCRRIHSAAARLKTELDTLCKGEAQAHNAASLAAMQEELRHGRGRQRSLVERRGALQSVLSTRTEQLGTVQEALLEVKEQLNRKGNSASDANPLVELKHATQRLRGDVRELDLAVGVLSHVVTHNHAARSEYRNHTKHRRARRQQREREPSSSLGSSMEVDMDLDSINTGV